MPKKNMNFQSLDSLIPVASVINEASEAVKDPSRTIAKSAIPEVLAGVVGAAIGGAISFTALWALGTSAATMFSLSGAGIMGGLAAAGIGGGAVVGIFVLAAPVAILACAGVGIAAHVKNKKLVQEKERLYKEALKKHDAIINELKDKDKLSNDRLDYLNSLNVLLHQAIKDLKADLDAA
jgi:hypothetical protein